MPGLDSQKAKLLSLGANHEVTRRVVTEFLASEKGRKSGRLRRTTNFIGHRGLTERRQWGRDRPWSRFGGPGLLEGCLRALEPAFERTNLRPVASGGLRRDQFLELSRELGLKLFNDRNDFAGRVERSEADV